MTGRWLGGRGAGSDDALLRDVYQQHGQAVLAYAMKRTGDRVAAEDVLQETLVRAWRHSEVLTNSAGSVRAWLFTVADRIIVDRARLGPRGREKSSESPLRLGWSEITMTE
jgi:RNA polymerase sigma-70 factor, ECF subfamily